MTSKIGVKTYARQKIACHSASSIQFDQVLDDKGNKPCAAKSKGTLHRWGMTSFTSLRNSQTNGRKDKPSPVDVEPKKRKPDTGDANDPFSFDFETDGKKKACKKNDMSKMSPVDAVASKNVTPVPAKTNKFFKSGTRSSLFGKSNAGQQPRTVPLLNTSNVVKQNLYFESINSSSAPVIKSNPVVARDAFAELLLSAEVPGVAGVTPAEVCLNTYPEDANVTSNMFSTYAPLPQTVRTYSATPSTYAHTYNYDQNFYQQPIQNQVLYPVSTIPQTVIQSEVIFPCPIIQSQPEPQQTQSQFPQASLPIIQNELAVGLASDQSNVNMLDSEELVDNLNLQSLASDSFSKTSYVGDDDLFDTLRKSSYSGYHPAIHQERLDPIPEVKQQSVYPDLNDLPKQGESIDIKRDDLLDHLSSNNPFMMRDEEHLQPQSEMEASSQISDKDNFSATVRMVVLPDTSIPKKDDWDMSNHEQPLMDQRAMVGVCENSPALDQDILESKLLDGNLQSSVPAPPVESAKKEWDLFSTNDNVTTSQMSGTSTSESPCDTSQEYKECVAPVVKSEPKSWEANYEPIVKSRLKSSLTYGGSSKSYSSFAQRRIFNSPKKIDRKAVYKHRPWQAEEEPDDEGPVAASNSIVDEFDEFENDNSSKPTLQRVVTWPAAGSSPNDEAVTAVKCEKRFRDYYTVVRNVKQAHQCHESGETQEYNDDVEYLLESLQDSNKTGTRCLSLLSLASKCMAPAFRMHLRAHGALTKVFSALHDAPKQPNLALCTATVLFVLSQDRLNMDLERSSLELMLQLLDTDCSTVETSSFGDSSSRRDRELDKNKEKVYELCDELQKKGYAKHLDLDNITADVLAMESLLSLTSKRAGEWFKEELRELGGLEHLVNTVSECGKCLPPVLVQLTSYALDKLRKLDRCLRVLENVTVMNSENQYYLINCQDSALIYFSSRALQLCETCLKVYPTPDSSDKESPSWTLFSCLLSAMKVLLNLTNENCNGSAKVGEQEGLINSLLSCVLYLPSHLTIEQRFDVLVLSLGLLINLVEYCENNRKRLFFAEVTSPNGSHHRRGTGTITAPKALVNLFLEHEDAARVEEVKTDKLLDGKGDQDADASVKDDSTTPSQASVDDFEETLKKALQKAGKNMEDSMIAAYIALLLGCIVQNNKESAARIRDHLPNKSFDGMVQMLNKFLNFMTLTDIVGSTGMKSIKRVIDILETS